MPATTDNEDFNKKFATDLAQTANGKEKKVKKNKNGSVGNNDRAESINNPAIIKATGDNILYDWTDAFFSSYAREKLANSFTSDYNIKSFAGIEGIPYQFLPSVDRRVDTTISDPSKDEINNSNLTLIGRKYSEKIITQIPLLFMVPCNPKFMGEGFTREDKSNALSAMISGINQADNFEQLIEGSGRFYSSEFAYDQYANYLNAMLSIVAYYLGIENEYVTIGNKTVQLKDANWADEYKTDLGALLSGPVHSANNVLFYIDGIDSINENFSNHTTQSQFANLINGFSETAKEIDYFFGSSGKNMVSSLKQNVGDAVGSMASSLGAVLGNNLAGGIVQSLSQGGVQSIIDGGKIVFPEMWSDSEYDKSYNLSMKFRSPDNDSLSIFLNVLKPYCKLLCFVLPHMTEDNANTYRTPFITRAYCKGLFNIDLGMITGLSVTKGATCCWNDDGLPTQIDVSIDLKDLYSQLTMTGYVDDSVQNSGIFSGAIRATVNTFKQTYNIVKNTAYMDFLANMAGLNINMMEAHRISKMYIDLFHNQRVNLLEERLGATFSNRIQNIIARYYSIF